MFRKLIILEICLRFSKFSILGQKCIFQNFFISLHLHGNRGGSLQFGNCSEFGAEALVFPKYENIQPGCILAYVEVFKHHFEQKPLSYFPRNVLMYESPKLV